MKKTLLTLFGIVAVMHLYAQKVEVSVEANSGSFYYSGASAAGNTEIIQTSDDKNHTNNTYGSNSAFGYGFAVQTQVVSKCGFLYGLQAGYDVLKSKTIINAVAPFEVFFPSANYIVLPNPAMGQTYLQDKFINLNPYVGYRLRLKNIKIDILPGADVAFNTSSYNKGEATTTNNNNVYQVDEKLANAPVDVRLKMGLAVACNRFGITASYARGITNYEKDIVDNTTGKDDYNAQSRLFRLGITYRIFEAI